MWHRHSRSATGAAGDGRGALATAATVGEGAETAGAEGASACFLARDGGTGCGLLYFATAFGVAGAGCDGVGCVLAAFATGAELAAGAGAVTTTGAAIGTVAGWFEALAAGAGAEAVIVTSG